MIVKIVGTQEAFRSMNEETYKKIAAALRRDVAGLAAE
jgi:hypothetical protein